MKNLKKVLKNNDGWGLTEMLVLSALLLIALLVASYFIYILYDTIGM